MKDIRYCASSFLMYRYVIDAAKSFNMNSHMHCNHNFPYVYIYNSFELESYLREYVRNLTNDGKTALALSGGIDSAILAKLMPKGSTAYTFRCVTDDGTEVIDETARASYYADEAQLHHVIIDITWDDMLRYSKPLMEQKNQPIHSIEVQIYKAAMQAKKDGFTRLLFGETADTSFGGLDKLLSRDWTFGEFVDRYSYVLPYKVLKDYYMDFSIIHPYVENGYVNVHEFLRNETVKGDYIEFSNPCILAGIEYVGAYQNTWLATDLDVDRIRAGEPKYLLREIFDRYYPNCQVPEKIPMPRPTEQWLKDWRGPTLPEFLPFCTVGLTGDQKWMVYILEQFLKNNMGSENK